MPDRQKPQSLFSVIQGGAKARKPIGAKLWECKACRSDLGVSTSAVIKSRSMPYVKANKLIGGHDVWVCAFCIGRGKWTPVQ